MVRRARDAHIRQMTAISEWRPQTDQTARGARQSQMTDAEAGVGTEHCGMRTIGPATERACRRQPVPMRGVSDIRAEIRDARDWTGGD
jgi:hypothetical protein